MRTYVDSILDKHLPTILTGDCVAVPDDDEEMNWRLFFAHSQDMQGFRADIFTGGLNEDSNPHDCGFNGLRPRWGRDSRSLIADLASVWDNGGMRERLTRLSNRSRPKDEKVDGIRPSLRLLHESNIKGARVLAETLDALRGPKVARKTNAMIRAYVQNSHLLRQYGCSFRAYLRRRVPGRQLPTTDITSVEKLWVRVVDQDFYNVGRAMASYMICDWELWLWREGRIDWFATYKEDSVHLKTVEKGLLPEAACRDFAAYCRTIRIPDGYHAVTGKPCPPRVLNECIWKEENAVY